MSTRLENLILSGLVALAVSVSVSGAANPLPAPSGPSDHDRLAALIKRVDALQNQVAYAKRTANSAALDAENALGMTDCIDGGIILGTDPDTGAVTYSTASDPASNVVPTLSPDCLVAP